MVLLKKSCQFVVLGHMVLEYDIGDILDYSQIVNDHIYHAKQLTFHTVNNKELMDYFTEV